MSQHYQPEFKKSSFHCPNCGAFSQQKWENVFIFHQGYQSLSTTFLAFCTHCHDISIWHREKMVFPENSSAPLPNDDLPEEIKNDYLEAREILNQSPRGSAALLRLVIQKICKLLGEKGEHINTDISNLVKNGLPQEIQQSLDYVRVIGNNAVHPGRLDIKDNREIAVNLFKLVNIISDRMITQPKQIQNLYNSLPISQTESISKRDGKASNGDNEK
ncbi:DUF4145 domain-containing protein [Cyclobacterium sp.]|uniref:DUF4145 domain-containing protein n=1 Tax=Cyclobacterium sp. TaxID=1966343 RepID=UPI0019B91A68|nr:DUF4145 domain-containing protein [Cyclobacterium sp.]MBD3630499.1 DUF4145 domain-containing protein [Cyclobacterium sp.]